jgi:4-aminobutyrate aminotransferase/(S)-3-amino-2-methylpropionate transaminase
MENTSSAASKPDWPIPSWGTKAPLIRTEPPGPKATTILRDNNLLASRSTSPHVPVVWKRGCGAVVEDVDGNVYIDFSSGAVAVNAGHCNPRISSAISRQASTLANCYDWVHDIKTDLIRRIIEMTPGKFQKKVYLCTIGSEAVENSVRLARIYSKAQEIMCFEGSFHGRATTLAATLCADKKYRENWGTVPSGIIVAPFAYCYRCAFDKTYPDCALFCVKHLERVLKTSSTSVAAVIVEPVQGAGGYVFPPSDYFRAVQEFCKAHDLLLIVDEIQSGFGRTGAMFASDYYGIEPDLLVLGKGLSSSLPISAVCGRGEIMDSWEPGQQSSTFGGNPMSCAAAIACIDTIKDERLPENAERVGETMRGMLDDIREEHPLIGDVRGRGCMIGVELVSDKTTKEPATASAKKIAELAMKKGLIVYSAGWWSQTFRIAPPLVITEEQARKGIEIFEECLSIMEKHS